MITQAGNYRLARGMSLKATARALERSRGGSIAPVVANTFAGLQKHDLTAHACANTVSSAVSRRPHKQASPGQPGDRASKIALALPVLYRIRSR
jgi:hypothetical protein